MCVYVCVCVCVCVCMYVCVSEGHHGDCNVVCECVRKEKHDKATKADTHRFFVFILRFVGPPPATERASLLLTLTGVPRGGGLRGVSEWRATERSLESRGTRERVLSSPFTSVVLPIPLLKLSWALQ